MTRTTSPRAVLTALAALATAPLATALADERDTRTDLEDAAARMVEVSSGDEILVTGRRTDRGVPVVPLDAVGSRDVFGPERVRETGARDMNDLIVNIPAISTRPYNGGEASAPSFSMRGLPDDGLTEYIEVLIDGVPASALQYGWTAFSFLPLTTERVYAVDYIRGAHSVRYSPNTVGGVLNFVTDPIPVERTVRVRQTLGDFGYASSLFSIGGTDGDVGALFTVVDRSGDGYRDGGDFDQSDWNAKLRVELCEGSWIAGSVSHFEDFHKAPGGLTLSEFDADRFANSRPGNRFDGHRTAADVVAHGRIRDGFVEGFAYWTETYRNLIAEDPKFGRATSISDWTDTCTQAAVGVRAQRTYEIAGMQHAFYGGARWHDESLPSWKIRSTPLRGGATSTVMDNDLALRSLSAHLDDTFRPIEDLTITAGVRWEDVEAEGKDGILGFDASEDFGALLPGVGAAYTVTDTCAVFGNWFRGFRSPQVWAFGEKGPLEDLRFERADSTELGVRVRDLEGLSASVVRWRSRFSDFGVYYTGLYENLGRMESEGTDLEAELDVGTHVPELAGLTLYGSVTWQDAELRSGPQDGMQTPYAWRSKAAWTVRYETTDRWIFSLGGTHVGRSYSDELETRFESADGQLGVNPSRTLWDGRVSKVFALNETTELEVAVGATNLSDHDWFVHSRGGFFGGGKVAGPPRQAYVSGALTVNW